MIGDHSTKLDKWVFDKMKGNMVQFKEFELKYVINVYKRKEKYLITVHWEKKSQFDCKIEM